MVRRRKSKPEPAIVPNKAVGPVVREELRGLVLRLRNLERDRNAIGDDSKEVKKEARRKGFDLRILGQMVREGDADRAAIAEREAMIDQYRSALGLLADTPLGRAALEAEESKTNRKDAKETK